MAITLNDMMVLALVLRGGDGHGHRYAQTDQPAKRRACLLFCQWTTQLHAAQGDGAIICPPPRTPKVNAVMHAGGAMSIGKYSASQR